MNYAKRFFFLAYLYGMISCSPELFAQVPLPSCCPSYYKYSYLWEDDAFTSPYGVLCTSNPNNLPSNLKDHIKKFQPMPIQLCITPSTFDRAQDPYDFSKHECQGNKLSEVVMQSLINVVNKLQCSCSNGAISFTFGCDWPCVTIQPFPKASSGSAFSTKKDACYTTLGLGDSEIPDYPAGMVLLNFTPEFRDGGRSKETGIDYKGKCWSNNCFYSMPPQGKECIDLELVLIHELGHVLGLAHVDYAGSIPGTENPNGPCNDNESFFPEKLKDEHMYSVFGDFKFDKLKRGGQLYMSCYMECALRAIYCPDSKPCTGIAALKACDLEDAGIAARSSSPDAPTLQLYPQPSIDNIKLLANSQYRHVTLQIFNSLGEVILTQKIEMVGGSKEITLPTHTYPAGVYYALLSSAGGFASARFVVKH